MLEAVDADLVAVIIPAVTTKSVRQVYCDSGDSASKLFQILNQKHFSQIAGARAGPRAGA